MTAKYDADTHSERLEAVRKAMDCLTDLNIAINVENIRILLDHYGQGRRFYTNEIEKLMDEEDE